MNVVGRPALLSTAAASACPAVKRPDWARRPSSRALACTTTTPAPSPKRTAVLRSSQSTKGVGASAPTTSAVRTEPVRTSSQSRFQLAHCVGQADFHDGRPAGPRMGDAPGHHHRRLRAREPAARLVPRRAQLPGGAPPLPEGMPRALPGAVAHRRADVRRARRPLHGAAVAPRSHRLERAMAAGARPRGLDALLNREALREGRPWSSQPLGRHFSETRTVWVTPSPRSIRSCHVPVLPRAFVLKLKMYCPSPS